VRRTCAVVLGSILAGGFPCGAEESSHTSVQNAYGAAAGRILGTELVQGQAYELLRHLTDRIGPRLSGSAGAELAVRWTQERLRADGLAAHAEKVLVPHWIRGTESAEILPPNAHGLVLTALGGSEPTPPGGVSAEVVEVKSFEDLKALGEAKVRGKIVLFNRALRLGSETEGYGALSPLRTKGAVEAARLGAAATLVRSLGTYSMRIPHTGSVNYEATVARIPAAAITAEDAELIHRLLAAGQKVQVRLVLGCRAEPDVESANVVADLRGAEKPDEIVLIGAHLDSWDLATGAIDDGAGVAMVMESLRLLKSLGLAPRRTIRGVLFMNEENGLRGGRGYAEAHKSEWTRHVAAIESDSGAARPTGLSVQTGPGGLGMLSQIAALLEPVGASQVTEGFGGSDITPLRTGGVPLLGLRQDQTHYFDWHHTSADTLDKVVPQELAENTAAMAVLAFVLADMPEALPRPAPQSERAE